MDRKFLTTQVRSGVEFITKHHMGTQWSLEDMDKFTELMVDHLVNNWDCIQGLQAAQISKQVNPKSLLGSKDEYEAYGLKYPGE